jgi:hypothetical protein
VPCQVSHIVKTALPPSKASTSHQPAAELHCGWSANPVWPRACPTRLPLRLQLPEVR